MITLAEANAHIPTEEVRQDLVDTSTEIEHLQAMLPGCDVLADRVLRMRIEVGIQKRQEFVSKLEQLLKERGETW